METFLQDISGNLQAYASEFLGNLVCYILREKQHSSNIMSITSVEPRLFFKLHFLKKTHSLAGIIEAGNMKYNC